jgi:tryptophan-rich hypothetical protein
MTIAPDPPPTPSAAGTPAARTRLSPKKLLLSKWTAVTPQNREKHFIVIRVIEPEPPGAPIDTIELQAVHSGRTQRMPWRTLTRPELWRQGWL